MIKVTMSSEEINSNAGLLLIGRLLDGNSALKRWDTALPQASNVKYSNVDIVRTALALMCLRNSDFADVDQFQDDGLFSQAISRHVPGEAVFRQRLERLAGPGNDPDADQKPGGNVAWQDIVDDMAASILSGVSLGTVRAAGASYIPLDIDVSVLDDVFSRQKEGVETTYHMLNGYAPIFCYAGTEGFLAGCELRPGSQHSQKGAVPFLRRCVALMVRAGYAPRNLLVRVDSGHDSADFISACQELGIAFIVKRNPRRESPEQLLDSIRNSGKAVSPRSGKTVFQGIRTDRRPLGMKDFSVFMAVEATERITLASGERLLFPEVTVDSWWTNLPCEADECVGLYHSHATSEQFHSELKTDMGMQQLPSGKFRVNDLILRLAGIAFNLLRTIGQRAMAAARKNGRLRVKSQGRFRLLTVLWNYVRVACKLVRHAGQVTARFGRGYFNFFDFKEIYEIR